MKPPSNPFLILTLVFCLRSFAFGAALEKAIDLEVVVQAPVADVWKAWTTSEGIETFFAPEAHVELRPGGPFQIFINPYAKPGSKGADDMQILAFQENKLLSFTWNAPPDYPEARKQRTVVILRFAPVDDKSTRVTLRHVGWGEGGEWDKTFTYFSEAWPFVLKNLQERFVKGPQDWTAWLAQMKKATQP